MVSLWGGWKMAGENMCIFIFCLHNVRPSFSIEISTVFAKNQSQTATPRANCHGCERDGGEWLPIRCCLYGFNGFPHTYMYVYTPQTPRRKAAVPGNFVYISHPKNISCLRVEKTGFFYNPISLFYQKKIGA